MVPAADLERALLILPYATLASMLKRLNDAADVSDEVELLAKTVLYMTRVHMDRLTAVPERAALLEGLGVKLRKRLTERRDDVGFNLATVRLLLEAAKHRAEESFIPDGGASDASATQLPKKKKKKTK
jgi:U3 small nucleolar RNA-associated protein 12